MSPDTHFESEPKVAIVVAVDHYKFAKFEPLRGRAELASQIADLLEEQGYTVFRLIGEDATESKIMSASKDVTARLQGKGSQVLLYFSGHTFTELGTQYFVAYDTLPVLTSSAVDVAELSRLMKQSSDTNVIVWLDAVGAETTDIGNQLDWASKNPRTFVFGSVRKKWNISDDPNTFSESLVQGLSGDASIDGITRWSDITSYTRMKMGTPDPDHSLIYTSASPEMYDPVIARNPQYEQVEVFFATDRARSGVGQSGQEYGSQRASSERVEFGKCRVSIPKDHRIGKLETASIVSFRVDPGKNIELLRVVTLPGDTFWHDLGDSITRTENQQVLVFVHGYRTSFTSAIRRAAQLTYDLRFPGPVVAYTWPSDDTPLFSLFRYTVDEGNVEWTTEHLRTVLKQLADRFPGATINLVGHSMGARALVNAVRALPEKPKSVQFRQIVLAAPDIDAGVFQQLALAVSGHAGRVTLYANSNDEALRASQGVHGYKRAGESGPDLIVIRGIDTIDASKIDTGLLGHSYYADTRSVVSDLYNLIRLGLEPARRFGLTPVVEPRGTHYLFNP